MAALMKVAYIALSINSVKDDLTIKNIHSISYFVPSLIMMASDSARRSRLRRMCIKAFRPHGLQLKKDAMDFLMDQFESVRCAALCALVQTA